MPYAFIGYECSLEDLEEELQNLDCDEDFIDYDPYLRAMLKFAEKYKAKVYWCDNFTNLQHPCLDVEDDHPGHPHVYFDVDPPHIEEALEALKKFCPNMNCKEVDAGLLCWMRNSLTEVLD